LSVFELFKERVLEVRKAVEEFKDNHKMASKAISLVIDSMPEPFNKFSSVIWNGLEKQAEGGADSSAKLLEILEKIENNTEQSFFEIKTNISELIQFGAKTEDIQKLGEQIRISNESVTQNLKEAFNEELKNAAQRLEENFQRNLTEMGLLQANLRLLTSLSTLGNGSRDCWKEGYLREEDVKNDYDARRPITDDIIASIEDEKHIGTILFGDAYYGKSTILYRVMFEEIEKGYSVIFTDSIGANTTLLTDLLKQSCRDFPKLLVIGDNIHKRGSEALFQTFNNFFSLHYSGHNIRFLFGARESEFNTLKETLEPQKAAEIDRALKNIHEIKLDFKLDDAILYFKKAVAVTKQIEMPEEDAKKTANELYTYSKGDPFMFISAMANYISEGKKDFTNIIVRDINMKMESLKEEGSEFLRSALVCTLAGMFGIRLSQNLLESCGVDANDQEKLVDKSFLFQNGEYKIRHELWAGEFVIHLYESKKFRNNFALFDAKYRIKDMIRDILNNIAVNDLINVLVTCSALFQFERMKSIGKFVVDNYRVPDRLSHIEKTEVYCNGLGVFYWYRKDYGEAIKCYDKAIELNPDYAGAWYSKGNVLAYNLSKYDDAIECYNKALKIDQNNAYAWYGKGLALNNLEKYSEAIQSYDRAIEIDPNSASAWYGKGLALRNLGKYNEAIECYDKALEIDQNMAYALHGKGVAFSNLGKYNEAIECYDKALEINPKYVDAWYGKGVAFSNLGKYNEAIECYDKALEINPRHVNAWYDKGLALRNLGKYNEAIECYDKAIEIDPNNASAWNNKGVALRNLGKYNEAIECYDKALEINPRHVNAWYGKGVALRNLGKYNEAIECYDKALQIDPNNAPAWYSKGVALRNLGKDNEAIQSYDKALQIDPNNAPAWYSKGVSLYELARYEEAIECYNKAIGIDPDYAKAWGNIGLILSNLGKYNEAIEYYNTSLEKDPNNPIDWNGKGMTLHNLGKYEQAIECFDKALEINPNVARIWYNKARSKVKKGNIEDGLKDLKISIGINKEIIGVAKKEKDFQRIINDERFKEIT
jgi:tetratricopeptide (TPR) repeat protein